jgi:thiol-disulfide isomerase/thioredoxin
MKILKLIIKVLILLSFVVCYYYYFLKQLAIKNGEKIFLNNIKSGNKNQILDFQNGKVPFDHYNFEALKNKKVIDIVNNKTLLLSDLLNKPNLYINFWFKGCKGCELEMPEIQKFYDKYKKKIGFAIISNDKPETVKKFKKKNEFSLPFYVFKDDTFPFGINTFPTSHLIINNKTQFLYAGVGHFDNDDFNKYIDSLLVK